MEPTDLEPSRTRLLRIRAEFLALSMVGVGTLVGYAMWALGYFLGSDWQGMFTVFGALLTVGLVFAYIKLTRTMLAGFHPMQGGLRSGLPIGVVIAAGCSTFVIAFAAMAAGRFLGLLISLVVFSTEFVVWSIVAILIVFRRGQV